MSARWLWRPSARAILAVGAFFTRETRIDDAATGGSYFSDHDIFLPSGRVDFEREVLFPLLPAAGLAIEW